jgi:hypothetical protein
VAYLIFNPDEGVGGIVFKIAKSANTREDRIKYECINGPLLHWDDPGKVPRQLATFALATSKLSSGFHSLTLRPRWTDSNAKERLRILPIEATEQSSAATLILQLKASKEEQFKTLSSRMQRTLSTSWKSTITTKWEKLSLPLLEKFVPILTAFSKIHGFATPPLKWFRALTQEPTIRSAFSPSFWLVTSEKQDDGITQARTQILVSRTGGEAHYLFGHEDRFPQLRSAVSTSATAHWEAITQCASMGIETYDFNGYICEAQPKDPYFGVCQFKKQFTGQIVRYVVPEFRITRV